MGQGKYVILFVLPPHTSHLLQPLDVGVFGPFKTYYYSECSNFPCQNIGRVITRYDMAGIACKAYIKATTPQNIQSAFRKTGIFPFKKDAVEPQNLYSAESFRSENPIEKVKSMKGGREEVEMFVCEKEEQMMSNRNISNTMENRKRKEQNEENNNLPSKRPNPGHHRG